MKSGAQLAMLLTCVGVCAGTGLSAQTPKDSIYETVNGEELAAVVREAGFVPEITEDSQGDPLVRFRLEGLRTSIFTYGCEDDRCTSYQFMAGFSMDEKPGVEKVNEWNRLRRFGRAYVDTEQDPIIEMDVDLDGGVTHEYLVRTLTTWRAVFVSFLQHVR
jgi:hypothetical protein